MFSPLWTLHKYLYLLMRHKVLNVICLCFYKPCVTRLDKIVARPGPLVHRASVLPTELPSTHGRHLVILPCFIRIIPNLIGTLDDPRRYMPILMLAALLSHLMSQGGKILDRPGLKPRASSLPYEQHSAIWATQQHGWSMTHESEEILFHFSFS